MKKIISMLLVVIFGFLNGTPALAQNGSNVMVHKEHSKEVVEADSVIRLQFAQDFDINEATKGQTVRFVLTESIKDADNTVLPKGTVFIGRVTEKQNSKFGFRRATANIVIDKMKMKDGREFQIYAKTEKDKLTSPAGLNIAKGVGTATVAAGVCIIGATAIAIECLSIGGIVLAPYTGIAMGGAIALTSKGLNYKASKGTPINIILKTPIDIEFSH